MDRLYNVQCVGLDNIFDTYHHFYTEEQLKEHAKVIIKHCTNSFILRNPDFPLPIQTSNPNPSMLNVC